MTTCHPTTSSRRALLIAGMVGLLVGSLATVGALVQFDALNLDVDDGSEDEAAEQAQRGDELSEPAAVMSPTPRPERTAPSDTPTESDDAAYAFEGETGGSVAIPKGFPTPDSVGCGCDPVDLPEWTGPARLDEDTVIDGYRIADSIDAAADVRIRNSHIESGTSAIVLHTTGDGTLTVEDSTVRALDGKAHLARGSDITLRRNDLRYGTTVIQATRRATIEGNFIADPGHPAHPDGHHDGVQNQNSPAGSALTLKGNTIIGPWQSSNSAVLIQAHDNWSGVHEPHVEGNFFSGGGYTFYLNGDRMDEGIPDAVVVDNLWNADSWTYGPTTVSNAPNLTWEDNYDTNGDVVTP